MVYRQETLKSGGDWRITIESSLRKVIRETYKFNGTPSPRVELAAARGGSESFQIVMSAPAESSARDITVKVGDLVGMSGEICASEVTVNHVGYIQSHPVPYPVEHMGWWPDPLLPIEDHVTVEASGLEVLWVNVYVPYGASAGDYQGKITLSPANAEKRSIDLTLRVWDFELPKREPLETPFGFSTMDVSSRFYDFYPENAVEIIKRGLRLLRRHRINGLFHGYIPTRDPRLLSIDKSGDVWRYDFRKVAPIIEFLVSEGFKFNIFAPPFWPEPDLNFRLNPMLAEFKDHDMLRSEEFHRRIKELLVSYVEFLKSRGWLSHAFAFIYDEPHTDESYEHLQRVARMVKKVEPSLKTIVAAEIRREMAHEVDVWLVHQGCYEFHKAAALAHQKAGGEVWWYVSNYPNYPKPTLFLDYPAVAHRILPWMNWKFGISGFHYYCVNAWHYEGFGMNFDPDPARRWPNVPWNAKQGERKMRTNGDGQIVYPHPSGPIGSIRLASVRDGIEDYCYLWRLSEIVNRMKNEGRDPCVAEGALQKALAIVTDTVDYDHDPASFVASRRLLGKTIENLKQYLASC